MHLTLFSDYAIRLLILLALEKGGPVTLGAAAEHLGLSKNHLVKVANLLVRKGYVAAVRGRSGGLSLNRPAEDIRIGGVLRDTEPGFGLVRCMAEPGSCSLEKYCGLPAYLERGMQAFLAELDRATLAEIAPAARRATA